MIDNDITFANIRTLSGLIKDKEKLKEMGKNASLISMPNAAQNIVEEILKYVW